ncbi:MAG: uncharacterized protein JWQ99_2965 [Blastococcus sp.]|nr:uncharacterized protein [Blastococcus sp.]
MINTGSDDVTWRSTTRFAAGLAVAAVVLSGCSEKQEANSTLPDPSSSAAETTPELPPLGPDEFPVPDEARQKTPDGVVEFVRYYVALAKFLADSSSDPQPLLDLSQDCGVCGQIAESLQEDLNSGYSYRDYDYNFEELGPGLLHGDSAEMGFVYAQGPITVIDSAGKVVPTRSSATTGDLQSGAVLRWRDDLQSWVITTLTVG